MSDKIIKVFEVPSIGNSTYFVVCECGPGQREFDRFRGINKVLWESGNCDTKASRQWAKQRAMKEAAYFKQYVPLNDIAQLVYDASEGDTDGH